MQVIGRVRGMWRTERNPAERQHMDSSADRCRIRASRAEDNPTPYDAGYRHEPILWDDVKPSLTKSCSRSVGFKEVGERRRKGVSGVDGRGLTEECEVSHDPAVDSLYGIVTHLPIPPISSLRSKKCLEFGQHTIAARAKAGNQVYGSPKRVRLANRSCLVGGAARAAGRIRTEPDTPPDR